jgi:hypothetical protein
MNLRDLSPEQFAQLGTPDVAYFKPVIFKGQSVYAVHTADGSPVALAESRDIAIQLALDNDLHPIWVH